MITGLLREDRGGVGRRGTRGEGSESEAARVHGWSRSSGDVRLAAHSWLLGCLTLVLALPTQAAPLTYGVAVEHYRRSWVTYRGDSGLSQTLLPCDLAWRPDPRTLLGAGADLTWNRGEDELDGQSLNGPSEFRLTVLRIEGGGRLRIGGTARFSLAETALAPEEMPLAEALSEVSLGLPRPMIARGRSLGLHLLAQPLQRDPFLVHFGIGFEHRGEVEFAGGDRHLDPGGRWTVAAGVALGSDRWRGDLVTKGVQTGRNRVDGGYAYDEGFRWETRLNAERRFGSSRAAWSGLLLLRARGDIAEDAPLDPRALRGGNAARAGLRWSFPVRDAEVEMAMALSGVRGFAGDLGHATWLEPGLAISRPLRTGTVRLGICWQTGAARSERDLSGWSASLSWHGGPAR